VQKNVSVSEFSWYRRIGLASTRQARGQLCTVVLSKRSEQRRARAANKQKVQTLEDVLTAGSEHGQYVSWSSMVMYTIVRNCRALLTCLRACN
jgi:hypothetical protein